MASAFSAPGPHGASLARILALSVVLLLAAACQATGPARPAPAAGLPAAMRTVVLPAPEDDRLLQLLAGQFSLQAGELERAAGHFERAAARSDDPELAAQAVRLALSVGAWDTAAAGIARWQVLAPATPGLAQARAWLALGEGRRDEAIRGFAALVEGGRDEGWRLLGQALLAHPDRAASAAVLAQLATPERLASNETAWVAMSQLAFRLGDVALATRLAATAIERFGGEDAWLWRARLAREAGDAATAAASYKQGLAQHPDSRRLRGARATQLAEEGHRLQAAAVMAAGPQDDLTYAARASWLAADRAALGHLYREVEADAGPRSDARLYLLGQMAERLGRDEAALGWYGEVPLTSDVAFEAGLRSAVVEDRLGRGAAALDRVHRLQAGAVDDPEQLAMAFMLEAELLLRAGRAPAAMQVYERALESLPDEPRLRYARALGLVELGDSAGAERDLRALIELDADDANALNALGYTLADENRNLDEAHALIRRALELQPGQPAFLDSLGWVLFRLGRPDEALPPLQQAWALQRDAEVAAHLGEVLWVLGRRDEAREVFEQGRQEEPDNRVLAQTLERLRP